MRYLFFALLLCTGLLQAQVIPLKHGHAHNDYIHQRPLLEALENGFTSIEIDVFLFKGELKVAHVGVGLNDAYTIEQLYLEPVKKIIEQNGGSVYKGFTTPVTFMIDFKTHGPDTYNRLKEILKKYESIVSEYDGDSVIHQRAINILISGASPVAELMREYTAFATIDADLSSVDDNSIAPVITRYSSAWGHYFKWKGAGVMPAKQKAKLTELVAKAHRRNKHIRFYHIPDKPAVWRMLLNAGVDWINTDKLSPYRKFYLEEYRR